jgi:hypothetical protein
VYVVVTSDNMATTSSDFSALASMDQNAPEVFWHHSRTKTIAEVELNQSNLTKTALRGRDNLEAMYQFAPTLTNRREAAPHLSPIALSITHSTRTVFRTTANSSLSTNGRDAQLRPVWRAAIQQLSMGFSNSRPSQSDQDIGTYLGGVSNPNVVSPHNDILSTVYDSRAMRYVKRRTCNICPADFGLDAQINFTRSIQGSTTPQTSTVITTEGNPVPVTTVSYPANTYLASPFVESQVSKWDFWKPVVLRPGLTTANVASLTSLLPSMKNPNAPKNSPTVDFVLSQRRTFTLGQDIGTRFEWSDFTYLEFGATYQRSYNVLSAVSVTGQTSCPLNSSTSLSTCTSGLTATVGTPLRASYGTYNQRGSSADLGIQSG